VASVPSTPTGIASRPTLASALAVSVNGMQAAEGRVDADARSIATAGPDVASMVDLVVQSHAYGALARVIGATDEMTRSAVDLFA
jgi:flagellar basal body rod protein FlgC